MFMALRNDEMTSPLGRFNDDMTFRSCGEAASSKPPQRRDHVVMQTISRA
jgi:hypothetical protein